MGSEREPKRVVVDKPRVLWNENDSDTQRDVIKSILKESELELAPDDDTIQPDREVNDTQG